MDIRSFSITLLALSLFCLSGAIVYFSIQLKDINDGIPDVLAEVEKTTESVEIAVKEIEQVRKLTPVILNEVMETRKQIPPIVREVSDFRKTIPVVLEKVENVSRQIPTVLDEIKGIRQQIPSIIEEVQQIRPLIPLVLDEIKKTREALPPMLSKAEQIVTDAKRIGKTTTEGAVTGVVTGIAKTPFEIVGGLFKSIFGSQRDRHDGVTKQDHELIKLATYQVLASAQRGHTRNWSNPQSGNNGTVTLTEFAVADGQDCRILSYIVRMDQEQRINKEVRFCLNEQSQWKPSEQ